MSEFIQFEAKEGKEENDEEDILEHIVIEELNSTDEGRGRRQQRIWCRRI